MTLAAEAERFREILRTTRRRLSPGFEWYPYDSLANAERIDRLLGSRASEVFSEAAKAPILDIGCGDGDLSFLLASLGHPVTAVDHPATNHSGMRGVRLLRDTLDSTVEIKEVDIDSQFSLPDTRFRLALFLGLLYHLKNPYYALERLAKSCDYCVLSTRIARKFPDCSPIPPEYPLAYLLAPDELNQDNSNYWIFNEAGLKRLLRRTHWEVVEFFTIGDTVNSDPVSQDRDERAYCLLRSNYGLANVELLHGWHSLEETGWRWVEKTFAIRCDQQRSRLTVRGFLPAGATRIEITVNGQPLRTEILSEPGEFRFIRNLPDQAVSGAIIEFAADKAIPSVLPDLRELALIVASIDLE